MRSLSYDRTTEYEYAPAILRYNAAKNLALRAKTNEHGLDLSVPGMSASAGTILAKEKMWQNGMGTTEATVNGESTCSQSVVDPRLRSTYNGATYTIPREWLSEVLCLA